MAKWVVSAKSADFEEIGKKFHIDPVIARIIRNRDILGEKEIDLYLNANLSHMHSPYLLKDIEKNIKLTNFLEKVYPEISVAEFPLYGTKLLEVSKRRNHAAHSVCPGDLGLAGFYLQRETSLYS